MLDPTLQPLQVHGPVGAGFNTLVRLEPGSGRTTTFSLGPTWTFSEPIHIASTAPGHEGDLAAAIDDHGRYLSEIARSEAASSPKGPIARIKLPIRLRAQVHGNWVADGR